MTTYTNNHCPTIFFVLGATVQQPIRQKKHESKDYSYEDKKIYNFKDFLVGQSFTDNMTQYMYVHNVIVI